MSRLSRLEKTVDLRNQKSSRFWGARAVAPKPADISGSSLKRLELCIRVTCRYSCCKINIITVSQSNEKHTRVDTPQSDKRFPNSTKAQIHEMSV